VSGQKKCRESSLLKSLKFESSR